MDPAGVPTRTPRPASAWRAAALAAAAVLAIAACSSGGGEPSAVPVRDATEIRMHNLKFDPPAVDVPAGTTITWQFTDGSVPHNVKGDGFSSPTRSKGTFTHRFTQPGTYPFRCTLHAGMEGRVVVR